MITTLILFAQLSLNLKVKPEPVVRPAYKSQKILMLVQAGAATFDGITTRRNVENGYHEGDPLTRPLIGTYPTYGRMAAFGALEVAGTYWLAKRYPRCKWIQIAAIVAHTEGGAWNLHVRGNSGRFSTR
jgi:hypothetical protein